MPRNPVCTAQEWRFSRLLPHSVAVLLLTGVFCSRASVSLFSTRLSCFFLALLSFRGFRIWETGSKRGFHGIPLLQGTPSPVLERFQRVGNEAGWLPASHHRGFRI